MTAPEKLKLNSNMNDNKSDYATGNRQAVLTSTMLLILFAYGPQM